MLYAILAYHDEKVIQSMTPEEDAALMDGLFRIHDRLNADGRLGPAARLGATARAFNVRGPGRGVVTDGPFAETKEHLLGFYVVDCATREAAVEVARDLNAANPSAAYEVRPIVLYTPNATFPVTDAGLEHVQP
jgi:hypothetical protein